MHINELSMILNQYFNFHKAHSDCLAQLVIAMQRHLLQTLFQSHATNAIQRFFRFLKFDPFTVASMVITLFGLKNKKLKLALDRTNWKFGRVDINILMLTVAYKGIALPLM